MTNLWKLLRLTTLLEFLPVLLVSLMALFTGLALLGASAWLVASAALMPPLYTLALGIYNLFKGAPVPGKFPNVRMATGMYMLIPCAIVFFVFQRQLIDGVQMGAVKG